MSTETETRKHAKAIGRKAVSLTIRARITAPDEYLGLSGTGLSRRLITTGSQFRSTVHDVLGRQSTKALNKEWATSERWKRLKNAKTKKPRTRLRELQSLLEPLILAGRLEIQLEASSGVWVTLDEAAANPKIVV